MISKVFQFYTKYNIKGAAIAQWIRLRLPSYHLGFEPQPQHLRFYQLGMVKFVFALRKEAGFGPFFEHTDYTKVTEEEEDGVAAETRHSFV